MAAAAPENSFIDCTENQEPEQQTLSSSENSMSNNIMSETTSASGSEDEAMGRLLQRMKTDRMYELRNIEHSHRPVTGQEHRQTLQQFMKKHLCDPLKSAGNVPANVDDVAEHRPESVIVEVQGIVEQRPVSSVLQSAAFRHRLENIIRGSLQSTRSRRQSPSQLSLQREQTPTVVSTTLSSNIQGRQTLLNHQQRTESPLLRRQDRSDSISSVESFSSALSSADQELLDDEELEEAAAPVPQPRMNTERSPPIPQQRRLLPSSVSPAPSDTLPDNLNSNETDAGISWNDISRVHREELVQELSELLHHRLVSSTLEGEFRATLEVLVENRVDSNGPAVQQYVQSLPGRGIPRNDFSHLGILNDIDNSDNISIASVSAHSVPYTQTNTFFGREIQSLKSQMKDMMKMIKMTHELQMDIQRSVRQEVAAALAQNSSGQGACSATCSHASSSHPVKDTHCLICLEQYSDSVLYQCGHMCVCYFCGKDLMSRKLCCPVCRAPIKDVIRAYKTNVE